MKKYMYCLFVLIFSQTASAMGNIDWHSSQPILTNIPGYWDPLNIPVMDIGFRNNLHNAARWDESWQFKNLLDHYARETSAIGKGLTKRLFGYYIQQFGSVETVITNVINRSDKNPAPYLQVYAEFLQANPYFINQPLPTKPAKTPKAQPALQQSANKINKATNPQTTTTQPSTDPAVIVNQKSQVSLLKNMAFYLGLTAAIATVSISVYRWLYPRNADKKDEQKEEIAATNEAAPWYLQQ